MATLLLKHIFWCFVENTAHSAYFCIKTSNSFLFLFQDDFRYLFTTNERLKSEYRSIQDEYKSLKTESSRLMLSNTEMQGEFNSQTDTVASLQLENAKLLQKCDVSL